MNTYQVLDIDTNTILFISHNEDEAIAFLVQTRNNTNNIGLLTLFENDSEEK